MKNAQPNTYLSVKLSDFVRSKVVRGGVTAPHASGVYAFFHDGKPVYIGISSCISDRLKHHAARGLSFPDFRVFLCDESTARAIERRLVATHNPALNTLLRSGPDNEERSLHEIVLPSHTPESGKAPANQEETEPHSGSVSHDLAAGPVLPGFFHISYLWLADPPLFPSEQAARWHLRTHKRQLAARDGIALLRGRLFIHPERFTALVRETALGLARKRAAAGERDDD